MLKSVSAFDADCLHLLLAQPFSTLVDSGKQAGPVGCSGIYWSKFHPKNIFFQAKYLAVYVHILFFISGDMFCLAVMILVGFPQQAAIASQIWPIGSIFILQILYLF